MSAISNLGVAHSRLTTFLSNLHTAREHTVAAASRITDVDVAEEAGRLVSAQIRQEGAAAVLAQATKLPSLALELLR